MSHRAEGYDDLPAPPDPLTASGEPLLVVGTAVTVVTAALSLAVAYGFKMTDDQRSAILGLVGILAPIVTTWVGRSKVYSPRTVVNLLAQARSLRRPQPR